jgi:hypothetical protein
VRGILIAEREAAFLHGELDVMGLLVAFDRALGFGMPASGLDGLGFDLKVQWPSC